MPPFGYAVVMSRGLFRPAAGLRALSRALLPHLLAQALLIGLVLAFPQITQWTRPAEAAPAAAPDTEEVVRMMRQTAEPAR